MSHPSALPGANKHISLEISRVTWTASRPKAFSSTLYNNRLAPHLKILYPQKTLRRVSLHFSKGQLSDCLGFSTCAFCASWPPFQETTQVPISYLRNMKTHRAPRFSVPNYASAVASRCLLNSKRFMVSGHRCQCHPSRILLESLCRLVLDTVFCVFASYPACHFLRS
jgi:hypothetical protein